MNLPIERMLEKAVGLALKTEELDRKLEDGGRYEVFTVKIAGERKVWRNKTATPIYRGVWQSRGYDAGDIVTFAGSTWIAVRETASRPKQSDDWVLSNKKGDPGKDFDPDANKTLIEGFIRKEVDRLIPVIVDQKSESGPGL